MGLKQRFSIVLIGMMKAVEGLAILGLICGAASSPTCAQVVTATIPPPSGYNSYLPIIAVNTTTNKVYAATVYSTTSGNQSSGVVVIDGATNSTTTVTSGIDDPLAMAVNPSTNTLYVANWVTDSNYTMTVIDLATNSTTTFAIPLGNTTPPPIALAVNTVTNMVYMTNGTNTVTVIDGATNNMTPLTIPANASAAVVNETTNQIYVPYEICSLYPPYTCVGSLAVIDGATNNITTINLSLPPENMAVNSVTNMLYVAGYNGTSGGTVLPSTLMVINGATNTMTATVGVGRNPGAVLVNPTTDTIYVPNQLDGTVTVINGATSSTTATVPVADAQLNGGAVAAVNAVAGLVYVGCPVPLNGDFPVVVIEGATNNTKGVWGFPGEPEDPAPIAVNPVTNMTYVVDTWATNGVSNGEVIVINGAANYTTNTDLTSSVNPSMLNASVTFTASVTENFSGTGVPTGTVTFMDGSTTLGTGTLNASGVATFATSSLTVGQHSITAVYGGDTNNIGSTSSVLTQTVNPPDFALTSNPTSKTITAGQSATFTLTVTPQGSFTSPISFSCSGLPALAGCTFNPQTVTPNSNTVTTNLSVSTTAQTASVARLEFPRGSSPLYAMWLVLPAMLLGTVELAAPKRRKLLGYCLVFLLVGGCLLQVACSGANNSGSGGGGTGGTPAGTYTVTVTGAAGSTQHAATVTLTVQ